MERGGHGVWPTSPVCDKLFLRFERQVITLCGASCQGCRIQLQCERLWRGVSDGSAKSALTSEWVQHSVQRLAKALAAESKAKSD